MAAQTGWICPRCEVVHAPFVVRCDCSKAKSLAEKVRPTREETIAKLDALNAPAGDPKCDEPPKAVKPMGVHRPQFTGRAT